MSVTGHYSQVKHSRSGVKQPRVIKPLLLSVKAAMDEQAPSVQCNNACKVSCRGLLCIFWQTDLIPLPDVLHTAQLQLQEGAQPT